MLLFLGCATPHGPRPWPAPFSADKAMIAMAESKKKHRRSTQGRAVGNRNAKTSVRSGTTFGFWTGLLTAAAALNATAPANADVTTGPVVLAPHRAIYDLSLERTAAGSGVVEVTGRIVYELTGSSCEGFTQNMRFLIRTSSGRGTTQETDLRTSSWEQVPSRRLRFSSSTYQNNVLFEQSRGEAKRKAPGSAAKVELTKPDKKTLDLSESARFPIEHSTALIRAARKGENIFTSDLYDGSEDGTKVYHTSAIIGSPIAPGDAKPLTHVANGDKLDRVPSWPVSISYFKPSEAHTDDIPLYEMQYRFHDNGITSGIVIDYGDYAVRGKLHDLTYLEVSDCKPTHQ